MKDISMKQWLANIAYKYLGNSSFTKEKIKKLQDDNYKKGLELLSKNLLLKCGELPRAVYHVNNMVDFITDGQKKLEHAIKGLHINNGELSNLHVMYPPRNIGADIATNLPIIFKPDENYPTFDEVLKSLDMFVPWEKYEVKNGFLNIWFDSNLIRYQISKI